MTSRLLRAPLYLDVDERSAWRALAPKLLEAGLFLPIDRMALASLCVAWCAYRRLQERARVAPRKDREALQARVCELQRETRSLAAKFLVIPTRRVNLAPVGVAGEDLELARLFTRGVPVRVVPLSPAARRNLTAWNRRAVDLGLIPVRSAKGARRPARMRLEGTDA